jgi:hypothetical protein
VIWHISVCKRLNAYVHPERPGRVVAIDGIFVQCDIDHPASSPVRSNVEFGSQYNDPRDEP